MGQFRRKRDLLVLAYLIQEGRAEEEQGKERAEAKEGVIAALSECSPRGLHPRTERQPAAENGNNMHAN